MRLPMRRSHRDFRADWQPAGLPKMAAALRPVERFLTFAAE
jgi:hypothetical protein